MMTRLLRACIPGTGMGLWGMLLAQAVICPGGIRFVQALFRPCGIA
jgi:hypothetical protein